jgi:N-methylhydantoinase B
VLRESEDGSAGLLDAGLRTVAVSKKLPLHFGSFSAIAEHLPQYYKMEDLEEGDIIVFNHPYAGNVTHPNDTVILMPVFASGKLVAFTGTLAHKADLGGPRAAIDPRPLGRGLVIPPTKLYVRGRSIRKLKDSSPRIAAYLSKPGDLRGQVAACQWAPSECGTLRPLRYRHSEDGCGELMARVAGQLRDALAAMPDGSKHEAEGLLDHGGISHDRPRRVHVAVEKKGERFSSIQRLGRSGARTGQCHLGAIKNTCYFGLMAMTDASLPFNHGFVDVSDKFKRRDDRMSQAWRAGVYYVPLAYLTADVVLHALGKFNPERAVGSSGGGGGVRITSAGGKSGKPWVFMELLDTALGASSEQDGVSLIHGTLGVGQFRPGPIEIHETEFPVRVVRFDVRTDSGGPGKFRGGLGCTREFSGRRPSAYAEGRHQAIRPGRREAGAHGITQSVFLL